MEQIHGYIEKITFQNPENGYTVAQLRIVNAREPVCIVGILPNIQPGETVRCEGSWKRHLVHGSQFSVEECCVEAPADVMGIKKYLGSGLIKGIGPIYAKRIVEKFGVETLHIIDENPQLLLKVPGLGKKKLDRIIACWVEQKSIREVMIFLQSHSVSPTYAQKIYKKYGDKSIQKVQENPFSLARDIFGIGFKTADTIAQKMGISADAPERIDAGIEYVLTEMAGDGHVCSPLSELVASAAETLEMSKEYILERIGHLVQAERLEQFELVSGSELVFYVWLKAFFMAEISIARDIRRLRAHASQIREVDTLKALEWVQGALNIALAQKQKEAVAAALEEKVMIITGGPGTGKSTITNAILKVTGKLTSNILLAAPTGRAAKRMTEITGTKASTLHSLLEVDFKNGGFKRNRENPLECDLIIVDEASMIDTMLMFNLLKAMPNHARIIFVGDIHQLPSVGPGNVLNDMIGSRCVAVCMLTDIFRQAAGSRIVTNAHRINEGLFPDIRNLSDSDFYFIEAEQPEKVLDQIVTLVAQRLPKKYGFHPTRDIQVLAPMKKGVIGIQNLNAVLQAALNPQETSLLRAGQKFQVGDKVMQLRNDYKREVFNGDIGEILEINSVDQQVVVNIDDREVLYDYNDLDELALAYAISVHKFQGSECPCVVMPVHTSHYMLLYKNLLYTGVTRGKKMVILVGSTKALFLAIKNDEVKHRHTGLRQAIIGMLSPL